MCVLSSNSRTVSFVADIEYDLADNSSTMETSLKEDDAKSDTIRVLKATVKELKDENGMLQDKISSLELINSNKEVENAADKADIADLQLRFSGWKMTAEAFIEKHSAAEEEILRLKNFTPE